MAKKVRTDKTIPKAIMFDLDDTLIESTIDFMKFRSRLLEYIREKGADMSSYSIKETTISMIARFEKEMRGKGIEMREIGSYLDDIDSFLNEIEMERIEETKPVPGAIELLSALRDEGIKIGIITRGSPEYAERTLRISGLDGSVDAVVARNRKSGIAPKPSPESAYALADKLGVPCNETVMVGDYSIDYMCARDSGIRFYGIASDHESRRSLEAAGCREILADLDQFRKRIGV